MKKAETKSPISLDPENLSRMTKAELIEAIQSLQAKISQTPSTDVNPDGKTQMPNQAESTEALRESEARLRTTLDNMLEGCQIIGFDWRYLYVNAAAASHGRRTPNELLGQTLQEIYPGIENTSLFAVLRRCLSERVPCRMENEFVFPDGSKALFEVGIQPVPEGILILSYDITERRRAEQSMLESEARLAGIVGSAMDAIITVGVDQRIVLFNHAAEKMFGYSAEEVLGKDISMLIPARFRGSHNQHIRRFGATGETTRAMGALSPVSGVRRNGEEFPIEASISQIEADGQKLFTVILRDITSRAHAEERLIEQAALLNHAQDAIVTCDLQWRVVFWNRAAERLYGWTAEEVIGQDMRNDLYRGNFAQQEKAQDVLLKKGEWRGDLRQFTKDGREIYVEGNWALVRDNAGQPKQFLLINSDITEKRKLEAQFLRTQRLESIGTLASGIAHDLNNILSPILMGTQMLYMKPLDESTQRLVGVMQMNAQRGADMVKQVLSFAKGVSGDRVLLQPKHLIREIIRISEETFPKSISIQQRLGEELWIIKGDATQLHQVLLNLCVNSRDAMPHGGTLTIAAENQILDELYSEMRKDAAPGPYVAINVTDTGMGIPADIIDRIFDPFFTTKEVGSGTGLGLATVHSIVTSHGGFITVESKIGAGTVFTIYLPASDAFSEEAIVEQIAQPLQGSGELILLVDDETALREITKSALETFGYRVLTAENGATGLSVFVTHQDEISAVITDLMMPVMDGIMVIRALRKLKPQVPIIAASGLFDSTKLAELHELGVTERLGKPYNAEVLLKTIMRVLQERKA